MNKRLDIYNQRVISGIAVYMFLLFLTTTTMAQTRFAVQSNLSVLPPYSVKYSTYLSPVSNKMRAIVTLTDLQEPALDVRFSLIIEGGGIRLQTKENFIPASPITLLPGAPAIIEGAQWLEYFEETNLDFFGIDRQEFLRNGRFPEGMYTFSIVVKDYASGKVVSRPATAITWLKLNDQPVINAPMMGSAIAISGPQNIFFQWQLNSPNASGIPFTPMYKLYLYELIAEDVDPIYALENGQTLLLFESPDLMTNSFNYTLANPALDLGKKYMFRVQAFDPMGENEFRDNGFSPNSWFYYGYPQNGAIGLNGPDDEFKFSSEDLQRFKFTAPDKLVDNQQYQYKFKIVELGDMTDDAESAIEFGTAWYEETTPPTLQASQYVIDVRKRFSKQKAYAWQVTAHTGDQQIAVSEVRKFQGPPAVDYFLAGKHRVVPTDITNTDLNNLAGTGRVKIFQNETDTIYAEVAFEGLRVEDAAGRYVLQEGEINYELDEPLTFDLEPKNELNAPATFNGLAVKLDKRDLEVKGYVGYPMPLPVLGGSEQPYIKTKEDWLNFNSYAPMGSIELGEVNSFDLLDPFGFSIAFEPESTIEVNKTEYEMYMTGTVSVPKSVKTLNGEDVYFEFFGATQLDYLDSEQKIENELAPIENLGLVISAQGYLIDFSEKKSPDKIGYDDWKGIYIKKADITLSKDIDESGQLVLNKDYSFETDQDLDENFVANIDGQGLNLKWSGDMGGGFGGEYSGFASKFNRVSIEIEDSEIVEGGIEGLIAIAAIDPTDDKKLLIPFREDGLGDGYLDPGLENTSFAFNENGGENRVYFSIKRAVFEGNDHLDLVVDLEIPIMDIKIENVKDFHLYGDYFIGFGERNGAFILSERPAVSFNGFDMNIVEIGASLNDGKYVFSYKTEVKVDEGFGGIDGNTPELVFHSITSQEDGRLTTASSRNSAPPEIPLPRIPVNLNPQYLYIDEMNLEYKSVTVDFTAKVFIQRDDPEWGSVFKGEMSGAIKQPGRVAVGGSIVYGKKDFDYFYLDAFYVDEDGAGITIFPNVNLVGMEGWIFHKMSLENDKLVIDKNHDLGFNLYGQFIDTKTLGQKYQMDGALRYSSKSNDVRLSGDISLINTQTRSPNAMGKIADRAKEDAQREAGSAAAQQVMAVVGDIDETVSIEGTDIRLKATQSTGSISVSQGGYTGSVNTDITGTPMVGVGVAKDGSELQLLSDIRNSGSLKFNKGNLQSELRYQPNTGGVFTLDTDAKRIEANVNDLSGKKELTLSSASGSDQTILNIAQNGNPSLDLQKDNSDFSISHNGQNIVVDLEKNGNSISGNLSDNGDDANLDLRYRTDAGLLLGKVSLNKQSSQFGYDGRIGQLQINSTSNNSGSGFNAIYNQTTYRYTLDESNDGKILVELAAESIAGDISEDGTITLVVEKDGATTSPQLPYEVAGHVFSSDASNENFILTGPNNLRLVLNSNQNSIFTIDDFKLEISDNSHQYKIGSDFEMNLQNASLTASLNGDKLIANGNQPLVYQIGTSTYAYLISNEYDLADFAPGIYTIDQGEVLNVNSEQISFKDGENRNFKISDNNLFAYNEFEVEKYEGRLKFGEGYNYKLDGTFPGQNLGAGAGALNDGRVMANVRTPDMNLIGFRTDRNGAWETYVDKQFSGELEADFDPDELDAYLAFGGGNYDARGKFLEELTGLNLSATQEGEDLEAAPEIKIEGPKYIGTIADEADGFLRGTFSLQQGSGKTILKGNVRADRVITVDGAFLFQATQNDWSLNIGDKDNNRPVSIKAGPGSFDGYFAMDPDEIDISFSVGSNLKQSFDFSKARIGFKFDASAYYKVSGSFNANYTSSSGRIQSISFNRFSTTAKVGFSLDGEVCYVVKCSDFNIASADLEGTIEGDIQDREVSGRLYGNLKILGRSTGDFNVKANIGL